MNISKRIPVFSATILSVLIASAPFLRGEEAGVVRGRIVDGEGEPVEGAMVSMGGARAASGEDGQFELRPHAERALGETREGRFFTASFKPLFFPKHRHRSLKHDGSGTLVVLPAGGEKDLGDVIYRRHGVLLRLKLSGAGEPAAGWKIHVFTERGRVLGGGTTGEDGILATALNDANAGIAVYAIRAQGPGGTPVFVREFEGWAPWAEVEETLVAPARFGTIAGTVNRGGGPMGDASLYLYAKGQRSLHTWFPVSMSDAADGSFRFENVPVGAYEIIVASPSARRHSFSVTCPCADARLEIEPAPTGRVEGFVEVTLEGRDRRPPKAQEVQRGIAYAAFLCDAEGKFLRPVAPVAIAERSGKGWRFVAENLPPGAHRFQFRSCERAKPPSKLAELPDIHIPSGFTYLHETWRVIPSPLMERISRSLRAVIEAGRTARVESRKDYTPMEMMKAMMSE